VLESAGLDTASAPFDAPLPQPTQVSAQYQFVGDSLSTVRAIVMRQAARAGLGVGRVADVVQAVNEVATNSLRFGAAMAPCEFGAIATRWSARSPTRAS
jgi:anti-sigma regulatory factor (Ser/Thr protein kinase)